MQGTPWSGFGHSDPTTQKRLTHLDLRFDQFRVDIPVGDARRDSDESLASCRCLCVCLLLGFRLYSYAFHDQRVKVEQGRLHDRFVCLEYEDDSDGTFRQDFGRVKGAGERP